MPTLARRHPLRTVSLLAAAVVIGLPSGPVVAPAAGNDIVDFLRNIQDATRGDDARRNDRLRQQQLQRYRPFTPQQGQQLPDINVQGLAPGDYETTLPDGSLYRFHVPGALRPVAPGRPQPISPPYNQSLVKRVGLELDAAFGPLQSYLQAARSTGRDEIRDAADDAEEEYDRAMRQVERDNLRSLQREFNDFSRDKAKLDNYMSRYRFGPELQRQLGQLNTRLRRIEKLLAGGSGGDGQPPVIVQPYDAPRIIGLAQSWARATQRLESAFTNAPVRTWQTRALERQSGRVRDAADSLASSALEGADFEHVSGEFRELDDAWQRLLARTNDYGLAATLSAELARQVAAIDHEMHQVLYVQSPVVENERLVEPLLHDVMRLSAELDRELNLLSASRRLGRNYWPLRNANAELNAQLNSALREVQSGRPIYALRDRANKIEQTWRQTEAAAASLQNDGQARYALTLVEQMETSMQRLARIANGEFGWRYQITP